jgi:hypothetical protein
MTVQRRTSEYFLDSPLVGSVRTIFQANDKARTAATGGYLGVSKVRRANVPVALLAVGVDRAHAGPPI